MRFRTQVDHDDFKATIEPFASRIKVVEEEIAN